MIKHLIYIPYYILRTPAKEIIRLIRYACNEKKTSFFNLTIDILFSSVKYNISFMDYFSFRFFSIDKNQRQEYLGSGAMYEFQLKMNPRKYRNVLHDKIEFLQKFDDLSGRVWATREMIINNPERIDLFLNNPSGRVVLKNAKGQSGKQVEICDTIGLNRDTLIRNMQKGRFDLLEIYVMQNNALMNLSPSALNTVRIVTQYHNEEVIIITARLRISINSKIDNVSAGNTVVPIDILSGKVTGPGIFADITKPDQYTHPVTGVDFIGFQIPFWKECISLVNKAALRIPENRSIGWDVAVTNVGPVLIEGNHNWHYLILQMPEKKGYKKMMMQYYK